MKKKNKKSNPFVWPVVIVVLLLILWLLFFWPASGRGKIKHIVLISIDTCRADHLSCYAFDKKTTPNIDRIAEQGTLFENVVSPVPITLPAHASMLTGLIPPAHGLHDNSNYVLPGEKVTLSEILKDRGFRTAAFVSSFVLDARFGLDQGFDSYQDDFVKPFNTVFGLERRGDETTDFAVSWLQEHKDEKFFLFIHYYDPHYKYDPPQSFAARFAGDAYSGEIAFSDFCLGRVTTKLKELGIYDSTLLIVTGDHGEMLGEHGEDEHMYFVYESAVKVPLIVKLPGSREPKRVNSTVGLIDIFPTVCGLLDIKVPGWVQGINLESFLQGREPGGEERFFYIESMIPTYLGANPLIGLTTGTWKYIRTTRPELYDLKRDPQEQDNLVLKQQKKVRIYKNNLQKILKEHEFTLVSGRRVVQDSESLDKLASLGYVAAAVSRDSFSLNRDKADPKDLIGLHAALQRVQELKFAENYGAARRILEELVIRESHFKIFEQLGEIALREENLSQAAAYFTSSLELNEDNYYANLNMGTIMVRAGKPRQAEEYFKKAVSIRPQDINALRNMGIVYEKTGRTKEACDCFEKILEIAPGDGITLNHLGTAMLARGREREAERYFTESLKLKPEQPVVLAHLAQVKSVNRNSPCYDPAGAVSLALEACRLTNFNNQRLLYVLVSAYIRSGRIPEAVKTAERAIEAAHKAGDRVMVQQLTKQLRLLKQK